MCVFNPYRREVCRRGRCEVCGPLIGFETGHVGELVCEAGDEVASSAADVEGRGSAGASDPSCGQDDERCVRVVVESGVRLVDAVQ